jgi:hypothetical protein
VGTKSHAWVGDRGEGQPQSGWAACRGARFAWRRPTAARGIGEEGGGH